MELIEVISPFSYVSDVDEYSVLSIFSTIPVKYPLQSKKIDKYDFVKTNCIHIDWHSLRYLMYILK